MSERREKGSGSVSLRPDGRQMARRTFEGRVYTAYSRTPGNKGKAEALKRVSDKVEAAKVRDNAGLVLGRIPTVAEYVMRWNEQQALSLEAGRIRKNTYDQRVWATSYLVTAVGKKSLEAVRAGDMTRLMDSLLTKGKKPATVHHVIRHAYKVFAQAVIEGFIPRNPVTEKPKVEVGLPDILSDEETICVLEHLKDSRFRVAFHLQAVSGLRSGELLALSESDLVLPEQGQGVVTVTNNWARGPQGWALGKPKTRRGSRQVPISEAMVTMLREHIETVHAEREARPDWPQDGALFVSERDGERPDVQRLSKDFKKAVKACGLDDGRTLTPHHLRHGFVTKALAAGYSPALVAVAAGHSAAVSINRYLGAVSASELAGITEVTKRLLPEK